MPAVCSHTQVVARCDRSPLAMATDRLDWTSYSCNVGLNESFSRNMQTRYDTYYDMQRKAYKLNSTYALILVTYTQYNAQYTSKQAVNNYINRQQTNVHPTDVAVRIFRLQSTSSVRAMIATSSGLYEHMVMEPPQKQMALTK